VAYKQEKQQAIALRKQGNSYSLIREKIPVSKATLSKWLEAYPLSQERIRELRDRSPRRIESFRKTMKKKRDARIKVQEVHAIKDIGRLTRRELFIAGFFLFWGEGAKGRASEVCLANTDPAVIRAFIRWIMLLGVKRDRVRFTLHLYADMNPSKEIRYWAKELGVSVQAFRKPYIKKTKLSDVTYQTGFGHGTCNARYADQRLNDYILMGLRHIRCLYEG